MARVRWSSLLHGFVRYTATLTLQQLLERRLGVNARVQRVVEQGREGLDGSRVGLIPAAFEEDRTKRGFRQIGQYRPVDGEPPRTLLVGGTDHERGHAITKALVARHDRAEARGTQLVLNARQLAFGGSRKALQEKGAEREVEHCVAQQLVSLIRVAGRRNTARVRQRTGARLGRQGVESPCNRTGGISQRGRR